jgi:hypothetical protein
MSELGPGCVETRNSRECVESFAQWPSSDRSISTTGFHIDELEKDFLRASRASEISHSHRFVLPSVLQKLSRGHAMGETTMSTSLRILAVSALVATNVAMFTLLAGATGAATPGWRTLLRPVEGMRSLLHAAFQVL